MAATIVLIARRLDFCLSGGGGFLASVVSRLICVKAAAAFFQRSFPDLLLS